MLTRRTFLPCLLMFTALIARHAVAASSEDEINALIRAIETSGYQFIRNGDMHPAAQAAEHLRLKYSKGKNYAPTAEAFIENLASQSSISKTPYYLLTPEGEKILCANWLHQQLIQQRAAAPRPTAAEK
ncbi:MAG TPA: DUF5329 family protein [Cellvibrionaceae bacterium]